VIADWPTGSLKYGIEIISTKRKKGKILFFSSKKKKGEKYHGNHPDHHLGPPAHRRSAHLAPQ
jgi:hypothetical protein